MTRRKKNRSVEDVIQHGTEAQKAREAAKRAEREAHEEAREMRLASSKRKTDPSPEDLLSDLIRVAEHELNPYRKVRAVSVQRYDLLGFYPRIHWQRAFGTFAEFKRRAGLLPRRGTRQAQHAITRSLYRDDAERYIQSQFAPYYSSRREKFYRDARGTKLIATISDTHATHLDPVVWSIFLEVIADLEPDLVLWNGDILDLAVLSRFAKIPGCVPRAQVELDQVRAKFRTVREILPDASQLWVAGNHDLGRWSMWLATVGEAISDLRSLKWDELTGVRDFGVDLAFGGRWVSPAGQESDEPRQILFDAALATHGTKTGKHPAAKELETWGMSGMSGHVHRADLAWASQWSRRSQTWMVTPMGCTIDAGRAYVADYAGWNQGFGLTWINRGRVRHQPVIVDDGWTEVCGVTYDAKAYKPHDPMTAWLAEGK